MKPIALGLLASLFFAITFVLNRGMALQGGNFLWSGSLRYFMMVPFLGLIVLLRGNLKTLLQHMKQNLGHWLLWSTVGFGLFYAPLCFAAVYGPSWLTAGSWQITIVAGSLLVPFFIDSEGKRGKIPVKGLLLSLIILLGVLILQWEHATKISLLQVSLSILPILLGAFSYPLGNRKMIAVCKGELDTFQRVLGMTLASLPFWFVLSCLGLYQSGLPSSSQLLQSLIIAISSGVIATLLFFKATDLTSGDVHRLAAVEATQSGEIVFAMIGEMCLLGGAFPSPLALFGIAVIILGMLLHSLLQATHSS